MATDNPAVFDEDDLVSCAGLVPMVALAEHAGLTSLLDNTVWVKSGAVNQPRNWLFSSPVCASARITSMMSTWSALAA